MEEMEEKWMSLKAKYPSEYQEWTSLKNEQSALQIALSKGEMDDEEFNSKNDTIEITLFFIELAVGVA